MASRAISSPVVTLASKKDSKSIGDLQNETFTVSNPKSTSCVNSVSSYKSPILRHVLDSGSQIKDTNQQVARPPDKSQHIVQEKCTPQNISPSNTLSQSNLRPAHGANQPHSPSPEHEQAGENSVPQQGGVCLERSFCQQCQKTMRSHYVEGSKHKIPKTSKSKNKAQTRNWKCCQCDVALISSGHLIYHLMKKHARSRCVHCDMSFNSKKKLAYHIKCKHEPPASCEVCGKVFRSGHHLKVHQATHNKELIKHFCELCGKGFRLRSALQMHMNVHTEDKPYKCPDCKATLKKHLRIHTGEKPYPCAVCGRRFRESGALKTHLRIHTGEKPYSCSECGTRFRHLDGLRKHRRTHTGEKPYVCAVCGKRLSRLQHLKQHQRIHTGEPPTRCPLCRRAFQDAAALRKHLRHHQDAFWGTGICLHHT
uniref:Si:ch1073-224n8.1 n=1 Tax=Astyanax mexicanus TaxID=7994 RepID=A0A3B1JKJ6_ASTMX